MALHKPFSETRQSLRKHSKAEGDTKSAFERVEPRIGKKFQISSLPDAKSWKGNVEGNDNDYGTKMWDSKLARESVDTDILESIVPHDRKEAALALFHENNYKIDGILEQTMAQKPNHGLDWSTETKQTFQRSIVKSRKDFSHVSRKVHHSVGNCQNYYYGTFKKMADYESLKKRLKQDYENEEMANVCSKCSNGDGELISCSICENCFHVECCKNPPGKYQGNWYCNDCDTWEGDK